MVDFESHKTVQFSRRFLDMIKKGKIKGFPNTDKILFEHILRGKVKDYGIVKILDDTIMKNKDVLEKYNIPYKSLSDNNKEANKSKKIFSDIDISIVGETLNVIEVRLPWITRNKFDKLIKFFKEDLDMQFDYRNDSDPVWYTVIRDTSVFDELMNNEIVKEIGYRIDNNKIEKSKEYLKEDLKKQKELFKLSTTANLGETSEFQGMFDKFYPFQKVAPEYSRHKNAILIADEMGLGKTLQALGIAEYHNAFPAICIVPANLRSNWKKEVDKWMPHRKASIIDSNVMPESDIYIISYNIVSKVGLRLSSKKPKMVILDESHYIKTPTSSRTINVLRYFKKTPIRILTTGTPILNRTVELVPQLDFLGVLDTHFGGKRKFIKRYAPPSWNGWGTVYGSANSEELQVELRKSCMIRRLKRDVLTELPDKMRQVVYLPLSDYKSYRRVEVDSINWYEEKLKQQKLAKSKIEEMVQDKLNNRSEFAEKMVKVEYLRQAAVTYKMDAVYEWVDNALEQSDKLILFAHHRDIVEKLYEKYKEISVMLYGGMSSKVSEVVDKFVDDKNIKLFIGSISSSGVGIDGLQKVCDKVAFVELAWTPAMMAQAEDRIHRIGQKSSVNIYYLIGERTVEEYVHSVVVEKEDLFEKTTNINKLFSWIKRKNKK